MSERIIAYLDGWLTGMGDAQVGLLVAFIALVLFAIWWLTTWALEAASSHLTNEIEMERRRQLSACVDLRAYRSQR